MTIEIIRPADRTAWLAARKQDITASIAGALLGIHPYTTPYELWAIKSGRIHEPVENAAMQRGNLVEPIAVDIVRLLRPDWEIEYPLGNAYWRNSSERIGATPDSFVQRPDRYGTGVAQFKTVSRRAFRETWEDPETGEINLPTWIAVQAMVEASLTGAGHACVPAVILPEGLDELVQGLIESGGDVPRTLRDLAFAWQKLGLLTVEIVDIPLDNAPRIMNRLRREVREFWRRVDEDEEPPIDWNRDGATVAEVWRESQPDRRDLTDDDMLDQQLGRYVDVSEAHAASGRMKDDLRSRILHALGSAEAAFTANWNVTARTQVCAGIGPFGQPAKTRILRIKPRENPHANF